MGGQGDPDKGDPTRARTVTEFLNEAREQMRKRHLRLKTEQAYLYRMHQFIEFNGRRHPSKLGGEEICPYLSHIAVNDRVAASTQKVALCALVYRSSKCSGYVT